MALTRKQQRFVDEYLIDFNATQAAIRAKYSEKTAYSQGQRLLKNAEVDAAINAAMAERSKKAETSAEWVLENLAEVARRCLQQVPVLDSNGEPTGEYRFEHAGANRALELIGKHRGMFKDVVEHQGDAFAALMEAVQGRSQVSPDDEHPTLQ